ncbi:MAG: hypothetical protein JWM80_1585 [Cyanobacteria bacterium RYN_339]|nr:hypothetical protein [Cyanobacteria bacterium RYN_339]
MIKDEPAIRVEPVPVPLGAAPEAKPRNMKLGAALVGLSGPLVGVLAYFGLPLILPIVVHAAGGVGAHFLWRAPGKEGRVLAVQARTLVICFPVVGSLAAWFIFGRGGTPSAKLLDEYKKYIAYERDKPRYLAAVGDREAHLGLELAVLPLRDQLEGGDLAAKQGAAAKLLEFEGGDRILREALAHPADETRLFASLALVRRQESMFARLRAAREAVVEFPVEPAARIELALAALAFAAGGGSGERVADAFWHEAGQAAHAALELPAVPAIHAEAHLVLCEERLSKDDLRTALTHIDSAVKLVPTHVEAALKRCELLFRLGRITDLRTAAKSLLAISLFGTDAHDAASFWTGTDHAAS